MSPIEMCASARLRRRVRATCWVAIGLACVACDDTRTVTPAQSPSDVGPVNDAASGTGGAGGGGSGGGGAERDAAGVQPPDTGACAPPSPREAPVPEGRCPAITPAGTPDPFVGLPCGAPLPMPGLDGAVQIVFTEFGVPHVYASTLADAVRAQAFLIAKDRFFQLELTRRATLGQLTGWLSQLALDTDIENRTFGQAQAARRIYEQASSPEMRGLFDAYAEGVNFYIDRVLAGQEVAPEEFFVLGDIITQQNAQQLMPHWTGLDVAAGAAAITYALAFDGEDLGRSLALTEAQSFGQDLPEPELRRAAAIDDVLGGLHPLKRVAQAIPGAGKPGEGPKVPGGRAGLAVPRGLQGMVARLATRLRKPDGDFGSNTWAVDAAHGRDGVAYLASDPHLALGASTFFYQIHLDTTLLNPGGVDAIQAAGVSLPGTPFVVIGHTNRLAWGITNLNADDTDFYLEKLTLAAGRPASTEGPSGAVHAVRVVEERYSIAGAPVAGIPAPFECNIPRYETADGRMLVSLEGTPVEGGVDCTAPPADAVNIGGTWLVPGDVDSDGIVSGVSLDFTGLDPNPVAMTVEGFLRAQGIDDFMQAQRHSGVFNNAQAVADVEGNVATTGFHAVPRRAYLRAPDGGWAEGGNPTLLIDATRFPSFEVTLDDEFRVVTESDDPTKQMVGFEEWPRLVRPERGFVVSANNELTGGTFDGDTGNETPYIGWNFDIGYRADRITQLLEEMTTSGAPVGFEELARVQNDHRSNLAAHVLGRMLADLPSEGCGHPQSMEARDRLVAWTMRGLEAASGVETFYHPIVTPEELEDSAATLIFNEWFAALLGSVLDDEHLDRIHWNGGGTDGRTRLLVDLLMDAPSLAGFDVARADHVFWDDTTTPEPEARGQILCRALGGALDHLAAPSEGGFGTPDMREWRWGMRHTVRFDHTFAPILGDDDILGPLVAPFSISPETLPPVGCVPADDPRLALPGFPRPGDNFCVDASTAGWNPRDWSYDSGPVQRLIVRLENGKVRSEVILPGGQSGFSATAHWADQARYWLGNERRPIHFQVDDVAGHGRERLVLLPTP